MSYNSNKSFWFIHLVWDSNENDVTGIKIVINYKDHVLQEPQR